MLALALGLGIQPAAGEEGVVLEDKRLYDDHPLYIDLDLDPAESTDDDNFVVMQEGSVILYAESGMRMDVAEDKTSYTLYNPSDAARRITSGTPVAFIDRANLQACFFLPTQVAAQTDRIVFSCSPESVSGELLFQKAGLKYEHTFDFNHDFDSSTILETVKFTGKLKGQFYLRVFYNLISLEVETWVSYDLTDAVLEVKDNFSQEIPLAKISFTGIPGLGPEIGVGLGLAVEGDTKISFELTGGKTGFSGGLYMFHKPKFNSISEKPHLDMKEIIAEGSFEADLTLGPSVDIFSVAGFGCDIAAGVAVTAELTGDEGGRPVNPTQDAQATDAAQDAQVRPVNPNVWHVCKELSCLQGEIDELAKLEAWIQFGGHVASVHYDLFRIKLSDFHYSFTFKEFKMEPCQHYLYQVAVRVLEQGSKNPMEGVTVTYTEVPPYSDRRGKAYIEGVTGEDGYVHLYMPAADDPEKDNVQITATSWQGDPDDPQQKVKKTVEYLVKETGQEQQTEIELPLYHYMELVYFEENADNDTVENMPQPFWVEENHTGTIPNEVPRRKGCVFVGWSKDSAATTADYLPGSDIEVGTANIPLYAIWTADQPKVDFRTITYVANGDDVVLADNPQIYFAEVDGIPLLNPWRKDHIFTGWTCEQIGLDKPTPEVTVQCTDPVDRTDFVNRTYVAHWEHMTYNVIWRNWDGSWLDVTRDVYDVLPDYEGPTPVRPSDDSYFYVFAGWTPEVKVVTEDTEYTAVYNAYDLLKLVSSPASQTLPDGEEAVFTVVTSGGVAPLAYQWYVIPAGQAGGDEAPAATAIPGATSDTLSVTSSAQVSGNRYYCVVQDQVGQKIVSAEALLTLELPLPPATGDGFPLWPALALAVLSGTALLIIVTRKKSHSM